MYSGKGMKAEVPETDSGSHDKAITGGSVEFFSCFE